MDHVFDELINLQRTLPRGNWRAAAISCTLRLAGNLTTGIAIGVGVSVGLALG